MTTVFSGMSISYLINNSNFIGIDTAFTDLTHDNRLFCTREEKIREKNVILPSHGVVDFTCMAWNSLFKCI